MKQKNTYVCQKCGNCSPRWQGKCHECGAWNSFVEEIVEEAPKESRSKFLNSLYEEEGPKAKSSGAQITPISDIQVDDEQRCETGISEFDRVLGGGLISGMFVLIGGDPGIGKSTLVLQVCKNLADKGKKTLYITGEESPSQIKLRAQRLNAIHDNLLVYPEISFEKISNTLKKHDPDLIVVDSIQTMATSELSAAPGSVSQIREVAARFMMYSKSKNVPVILVGHVTKDGMIAGPKILEHMVDTVLYFEGDSSKWYRILRSVKNRFGSTNEIGIFEMSSLGLKEITNPSEIFINQEDMFSPGSVIVPTIEGTRPILVELQALVSPSNYGQSKRTVLGVDQNRVSMLIAVIEKHLGMSICGHDVYLNVVGGLKVLDPGMDLAIIMAIISSFKDKALSEKTIFLGEVGLTGEVRGIGNIESRINESVRLGFRKIVIPKSTKKSLNKKFSDIEFIKVSNVSEILEIN